MIKLALRFICISLAVCAISSQATDFRANNGLPKNAAGLFTTYLKINGKNYSSVDEYNYRSRVFQQNLNFVLGNKASKFTDNISIVTNGSDNIIKISQTGNACDFEMSMNKFFDLSDEEFKSYYLLPSKFFDEKTYNPVSKIITEESGEPVLTTVEDDTDLIDEVIKMDVDAESKKEKRIKGVANGDGRHGMIKELRSCLNGMKKRMDVKKLTQPANQGRTKTCQQVINIQSTIKNGQNFNLSYSQTSGRNNGYNFAHQFAERKLQSVSYPAKYLAQKFDNYASIGNVKVPTFLDWNQISPLTPVKDQKKCNSCYVFSATSALEAHNGINNNSSQTLAEQEILDCSSENSGCTGGQPYLVYDYVIQNGLAYDTDYAYTAKAATCKANNISSSRKFDSLRGYVFPKPGVLNVIKALQYGPVVILMHASNELKYYYDGIYEGQGCTEDDTPNHSAMIYGYDLTAETPYFMLKNNWGTGWGDNGYYKMAIGPLTSSNMGYCLLAQTRYNVLPVMKK